MFLVAGICMHIFCSNLLLERRNRVIFFQRVANETISFVFKQVDRKLMFLLVEANV